MYSILSSAHKDALTFPFSLQSFYFFLLFDSSRENFKHSLNEGEGSGNPCLTLDLVQKLWVFSISYDVSTGLKYLAFINLKYVPFTLSLSGALIMKSSWLYQKGSLYIEMTVWSLSFSPFIIFANIIYNCYLPMLNDI